MSENLPKSIYQGEINIGDTKFPCGVLEDGTRILRERSIARALGKKGSGWYWQRKKTKDGNKLLPEYVSLKILAPYIQSDTRNKLLNPIRYRAINGQEAWGLPAEILPEVCNIWLLARDNGALIAPDQSLTAKKAEILMRGLAHIGIIALIDEATGYQEIRDRKALENI
jgi:hypothetical protein